MTRPSTKIEAVVLDLGGVVFEIDWSRTIEALALRDPQHSERFVSLLSSWPLHDQYERGMIDSSEFFKEFAAKFSPSSSHSAVVHAWNRLIAGPIRGVEPLLDGLQKKIPVYALSNTNAAHFEHICATYDCIRHFRHIFTSFHFGLRKPDRRIFERLSESIGIPAKALLFIDDTPDNIAASTEVGFQSELCVNSSDRLKDIFTQYL